MILFVCMYCIIYCFLKINFISIEFNYLDRTNVGLLQRVKCRLLEKLHIISDGMETLPVFKCFKKLVFHPKCFVVYTTWQLDKSKICLFIFEFNTNNVNFKEIIDSRFGYGTKKKFWIVEPSQLAWRGA